MNARLAILLLVLLLLVIATCTVGCATNTSVDKADGDAYRKRMEEMRERNPEPL